MSVVVVHPRQRTCQGDEWARMIPGDTSGWHDVPKKDVQSVKSLRPRGIAEITHPVAKHWNGFGLLTPAPLQTRCARKWLRAMAADWALISLNWLLVGALLVPLRFLFPRIRSFAYTAGAPIALLGMAVLHAALITLVAYVEELHFTNPGVRRQLRVLGKSVVLATGIACVAYALQGAPWITTALFCTTGVLHFFALGMWRRHIGEYDGFRKRDTRNVLIIGASAVGRRLAAYVEQNPAQARRVCGFLDDERPFGNGVIGRAADLARVARQEFVDEVILAAPSTAIARQVLNEARCLRLDVEIVPDLFGCDPVPTGIEMVGGLPLVCLHAERLPALGLFLKRLADLCAAAWVLVLLSPMLAVIAASIKLDSEGPIFYCAQRAGRKGKLFRCYKFRTMFRNAETLKTQLREKNERAGPFFKMACDPRITRVGRYLRRYSLDELPQLWNILRGEMSLVGPRPHPLDDVAGYDLEHLARLDVTPGLTGLWQVTARRDPSFDRGMELDREYIRSWSLSLDLRILLRTFRAVLQGSGQ